MGQLQKDWAGRMTVLGIHNRPVDVCTFMLSIVEQERDEIATTTLEGYISPGKFTDFLKEITSSKVIQGNGHSLYH